MVTVVFPRVGVETDTIVIFKRLLDRYMDIQGMECYVQADNSGLGIMFSTDIVD